MDPTPRSAHPLAPPWSPAAVLCDLDGLLVDSEALYRAAFARAAAEQGAALDDAFYGELVGRSNDEAEALVAARFGPAFERQRFARAWREHWDERLPTLVAKPGAHELLALFAERAIPCAVASSSERAVVERSLAAAGLPAFAVIAAGDEVERAKPAPDVFLLAASRLGARPAACLVLEDSPAGLRAARAAGMSAILVPDLAPPPHATTAPVFPDLFAVVARLSSTSAP